MKRCDWPKTEPGISYHDLEWGVPCHDDRTLFEYIVLDTFQAGLSWNLMLKKREGFRKAFLGFNPVKIARFTEADEKKLMANADIIRNGQKIRATVKNAKAFLKIQKEFGSFDKYIWQFTNGKTIKHKITRVEDYATMSPESEAMSRDMKSRGFGFVGPTTCHAFMQGIGMINDHMTKCFRYNEV